MTKQEILIKFLMEEEGKGREEINLITNGDKGYYDKNTWNEYLILTDEEANNAVKEEIINSLWAFNLNFIVEHCGLDYNNVQYTALIQCVGALQEKLCERANDIIKALISNLDDFIDDAMNTDGRGHFLSFYDGVEHEIFDPDTQKYYYIYRIN